MEFNFLDKLAHNMTYCSKTLKNYPNDRASVNLKTNKLAKSNIFHMECKYTKKKICYCKFYDSQSKMNKANKDFSSFLIDLVEDNIDIDFKSDKINFFKKDIDYSQAKEIIDKERIPQISYTYAKNLIKGNEETMLTMGDYREIERSINEDKKVCEYCKVSIYENNYHKVNKNDSGDMLLLCITCSKKYFNGALEIKFDNMGKRDDYTATRTSVPTNNYREVPHQPTGQFVVSSKNNKLYFKI
jgi:hypothetical protein